MHTHINAYTDAHIPMYIHAYVRL